MSTTGDDDSKKGTQLPDPTPEERPEEKKELITYPTVYTFKVMGKQEHGFREYVHALFHRLMGSEVSPDSISELPSKKGTYLSLSVSVYLLSEDQRRGIYESLHREKRIIYYL
jgi:putative lipoic acid-binding regulatory protein